MCDSRDKHSDPFYVEHFKDVLLVWGISYSMEPIPSSFTTEFWPVNSGFLYLLSYLTTFPFYLATESHTDVKVGWF